MANYSNHTGGPCAIFYRPLIPATLSLISGIALGAYLPGFVYLSAFFFLAGAAGCIVCVIRRRPTIGMPLVLFFFLGYFSIQPWVSNHLPADHISHFVAQGKSRVVGIVVDSPLLRNRRVQFVLRVAGLSRNGAHQAAGGKVRVTVQGDCPDLSRGDRIEITGYVNAIRDFYNPGGFDYKKFMALQGIRARMSARGEDVRLLSHGTRWHWRSWLDDRRLWLAGHMDNALAGYPADAPHLLKALIIGDRRDMPYGLKEQFARAGVGHVMAISGLHIGMVAAVVFFVSVRLSSWIPAILDRAWTRKVAALFSLVAVGGYALLAGLSPSTQRAAIMAAALLLAVYWIGRRHDWLNAVALAALAIGSIHPPAVLSVSFKLSFCAVLAILAGVGRLSTDKAPPTGQGMMKRWGRRILMSLWVSALAAAGTLPLMMMYFNQVSVAGVAANLVVVPLLGWLVIPLGLAGVPILMFSPGLAYACWRCAGFGLEAVLAVVAWIAGRPFAAFHTVTPTVLEVILYYGCFVLVLNWKKMRRPVLVLVPILAMAVADGAYWYYQRFGCRKLRVTTLDVGQGSANLIQLPAGQTVLVDGGGFGDNSTFDVGRLLVAPYLWRLKISTVDLVVLTHPNSDHLNGLNYILEHFHVPQVWSNHEAADTVGYRQWQEIIRENGIMHPAFEQLDRKQTIAGVTFEILAPEPGFLQRRSLEPWRNENEDSLVLKVSLGDISFLICGDIGYRAEKHLVNICDGRQLQSTVLLVSHHGSQYGSSAVFLRRVQPEQAVISAGWRNRYGFPHPDVLRRLGTISCKVWRTDQSGAVRIATDGTEYSVKSVITSR